MWKNMIICSALLLGCKEWKRNPDGQVEELVEAVIEGAIEQGAALVDVELQVDIDFTPESPEPTVRSEESQGD